MSVGHLHGWRGILQTFPKQARLSMEKVLAKATAPWWDPTDVWNAWGSA